MLLLNTKKKSSTQLDLISIVCAPIAIFTCSSHSLTLVLLLSYMKNNTLLTLLFANLNYNLLQIWTFLALKIKITISLIFIISSMNSIRYFSTLWNPIILLYMPHHFSPPGMLSATASLGLILLWDVDGGLTQIDKYLYSGEDYIKVSSIESLCYTYTDRQIPLLRRGLYKGELHRISLLWFLMDVLMVH